MITYQEKEDIKTTFKPQFFELAKYEKLDYKDKRQKIVNLLISNYRFATLPNDEVYIYKDGIYTQDAEKIIKQATVYSMGIDYSREDYLNVLDRIKAKTFEDLSFFDAPPNLIPLSNGILNIDNMWLEEYNPECAYHFFSKLPIEFHDDTDFTESIAFYHHVTKYEQYCNIPYAKSNP